MQNPQHRRPNRLEIDCESVIRRVAALRRRVGRRVKIFAALKADGYGFGTLPMARAALAGGADALSLIDRAEAIALRQAGIDAPILLYAGSPIDAEAVAVAERSHLILTVLNEQQIEFVARACADAGGTGDQAGGRRGADRGIAGRAGGNGAAYRRQSDAVAGDRQRASDVPR